MHCGAWRTLLIGLYIDLSGGRVEERERETVVPGGWTNERGGDPNKEGLRSRDPLHGPLDSRPMIQTRSNLQVVNMTRWPSLSLDPPDNELAQNGYHFAWILRALYPFGHDRATKPDRATAGPDWTEDWRSGEQ